MELPPLRHTGDASTVDIRLGAGAVKVRMRPRCGVGAVKVRQKSGCDVGTVIPQYSLKQIIEQNRLKNNLFLGFI